MDNDLISREALRESVIKQIKNHKDITFKEIAEIWIDCLNNAPTVHYITDNCGDKCEFEQPQGEWIPVSERLPEIDVDVIVTDIETSNTYQAYYIGNGYWDCDSGVFNNRVIAWQPLPEPYKQD